jgi:hypothetical protein
LAVWLTELNKISFPTSAFSRKVQNVEVRNYEIASEILYQGESDGLTVAIAREVARWGWAREALDPALPIPTAEVCAGGIHADH